MPRRKQIYKITYPNGKIYVGGEVRAMEVKLIRETAAN